MINFYSSDNFLKLHSHEKDFYFYLESTLRNISRKLPFMSRKPPSCINSFLSDREKKSKDENPPVYQFF